MVLNHDRDEQLYYVKPTKEFTDFVVVGNFNLL